MSVCAAPLPIVRIFKDFDKMSAKEQQHAIRVAEDNNNDDDTETDDEKVTLKFVAASIDEKDCCTSSNEEDFITRPRPLRQRKRSTSNVLYKPSKAFAENHVHGSNNMGSTKRINSTPSTQIDHSGFANEPSSRISLTMNSNQFESPVLNFTASGSKDGLRKQLLVRRSPSPSFLERHTYKNRFSATPYNAALCLSPGYAQYQMALLEVPMPRDYGDASSDDLSSEWDSDVPEPQRSPKVFIFEYFVPLFMLLQRHELVHLCMLKIEYNKILLASVTSI